MQEKQIVVNGLLINYLEKKTSDAAPTVVFLHGWRANAEIWKSVIERLLRDYARNDTAINVYALDLPGFGKSEMPKKPFTVSDYAEVVKGFVEKLRLEYIILVGHSFGGRIAINFSAEKFQTISKLVLIDSAGFKDVSVRKSAIGITAKLLKPLVPQTVKNKLYKAYGTEDYIATPELKQTYLNIINEDLSEGMKKISVPTLIIWGDKDKETPVESGKRMHGLIRDSRFEILSGAGHYSFLDRPQEFTQMLRDFMA